MATVADAVSWPHTNHFAQMQLPSLAWAGEEIATLRLSLHAGDQVPRGSITSHTSVTVLDSEE